MKILGIWDGHDSGAAIIEGKHILFAINEERLTRRKLEVGFPYRSIVSCIENTGTKKSEIQEVALSTSDFAKTLTRLLPSLKEEYYLIRRRKKVPNGFQPLKKWSKYFLTEFGPSRPTRAISNRIISNALRNFGFTDFRLHLLDHHRCHAATAAYSSEFEQALVITLDGVGDGLSGSIYQKDGTALNLLSTISSRHSLGVFFEHVTNLLNMRELEDEGKVMALANYAYPIVDEDNPLMDLIKIKGLQVECRYLAMAMLGRLRKIMWQYPSEQFAYMAQRTLEAKTVELVSNALRQTGLCHLCLAGGVFANVKLNRLLRLLPEVQGCYVFPHMGDGGLALGAAMELNNQLNQVDGVLLNHARLGTEYSDNEVEEAIEANSLAAKKCDDIVEETAKLVASGEIVYWYQDRMEYGPRALGSRSIIARPDSEDIKDQLNLRLKRRVWYQPFCPSILEEDARDILEDYDGHPNEFMTQTYMVRPDKRPSLRGVINVDGSCRPQIIPSGYGLYGRLLSIIKELTGQGVVLNTSLNLHGEPLVCSPKDAVSTFLRTQNRYMAIHQYLVKKT